MADFVISKSIEVGYLGFDSHALTMQYTENITVFKMSSCGDFAMYDKCMVAFCSSTLLCIPHKLAPVMPIIIIINYRMCTQVHDSGLPIVVLMTVYTFTSSLLG